MVDANASNRSQAPAALLDPLPVGQRLRRLIAATGPISIADYMAAANAHYYATRDPLGAAGDFTTAPEISQMFGELIGLALADVWHRAGRPDVTLVELGPGRGTLSRDASAAMAKADLVPPLHFVETSPTLRARQSALLPHVHHHDAIDSLPNDTALLIVANEFFDALPVHQLVRTDAGWREVMVGLDGDKLAAAPGITPMDTLVPAQLKHAPVGSIVEHSPASQAIFAALAQRLTAQGGVMLIIDYGYAGPAIGDTLQAVRAHKFTDALIDPGEADLTAHVDFTALANAAGGLNIAGPIGQGDWLIALGIDARCAALAMRHPDRATELAAQRDRLVKSDAMGQLFKVAAFHHPHWPRPAGFSK